MLFRSLRLLDRHLLAVAEDASVRDDPDVLLRVSHLKQYFRSGQAVTKAVDDISFYVKKGEVFGLVGESGCGKTTTGRTIINLYDPTEGDVYFEGLRISSGKNGLPVLSYTLRRDATARIARLKESLREQLRQNPCDADKLRKACRDDVARVRRELSDRLAKAQGDALEAEAEKHRAVQLYRQRRREQLTREFEAEAASLNGSALKARRRRYREEMKAASKTTLWRACR